MCNQIVCLPKKLPRDQWIAAAQTASKINPVNHPPIGSLMQVMPGFTPQPEYIAVLTTKYWGAGGVHLTVGFLDNAPADLRARILLHMNAWSAAANVQFVETKTDPQVRIARTQGHGYWSYLGTDILHIAADQPTMNLDSFTMNTPDSEFHRVVRHETGHTLGFPHEHMRKELVDDIDPDKAIAFFGQQDGWSPDQVRQQVLTPIEESSLRGTAHADPNSIMCYQIPGSITKNGKPILGGTDIDPSDYNFAAQIYPKPGSSNILSSGQSLQPGQSLKSNNQLYTLTMQTDGNVILYDRNSRPLWSTNTGKLITPHAFIMQTDGNLVLYDTNGSPKWSSNTWKNPGAFFKVQDDGNLVVYRAGSQTDTANNALWTAASNRKP